MVVRSTLSRADACQMLVRNESVPGSSQPNHVRITSDSHKLIGGRCIFLNVHNFVVELSKRFRHFRFGAPREPRVGYVSNLHT